jgi:hypothetical protein
MNEIRFCRTWSTAIESGEKHKRMLWDLDSIFEANWVSGGAREQVPQSVAASKQKGFACARNLQARNLSRPFVHLSY